LCTRARDWPILAGDFEDLTAAGVEWEQSFSSPRSRRLALVCSVRLFSRPPTGARAPLRKRTSDARPLSWGCPKIAPPSGCWWSPLPGADTLARLRPRSERRMPWRSRARRSRSDLAVSTTSPGFSSTACRGVAPGARSWGSARFARLRLSPGPRSPRCAPALRSLAPRCALPAIREARRRGASPPVPSRSRGSPLTRTVRRSVTPVPLPARGSPNPLPPRRFHDLGALLAHRSRTAHPPLPTCGGLCSPGLVDRSPSLPRSEERSCWGSSR
jgi:hypothetical protein